MDLDSDLEAGDATVKRTTSSSDAPPAYDGPPGGGSSAANRDASPLPAPIPQKPAPIPRESLDGETIFAVGEGGDSDDESEDGERAGLTRGMRKGE